MSNTVPVSKRVMLINSASTVAGRVISAGVMVWVAQHLINRLPPAEYSLLPVVMGVLLVLPVLTTVLRAGLGRYVTEALARDDHERITEITSTMSVLTVGAALLLAGVGSVLAWFVDEWLRIDPALLHDAQLMIGLVFAGIAVQLALGPFVVGFYARQRFFWQTVIDVGHMLLRAALILTLILGVSARALWVVLAMVLAQSVAAVVRAIVSRALLPSLRFRLSSFNRSLVKEIGGFGLWTSVGRLGHAIRNAADPIILNQFAGSFAVNAFHVGAMIDRQCRMMLNQGLQPIEPALTSLHATEQTSRLRRAYRRGGRMMMWTAFGFATPMIVFRDELLSAYLGPAFDKYPEAAPVLLLLLLTLALQSSNQLLGRVARAQANVGLFTRRILLMNLINLGLTLFLVGGLGYGAIACAAATFSVLVVALPTMMWPLAKQLIGIRRRDIVLGILLPGMVPALVGGAVGELLRQSYRPSGWLDLAVVAIPVLVAYATALFAVTEQNERKDLARVTQRVPGLRKLTEKLANTAQA
jgi:O-antigen/teichoic acid export membrane protein